MKQKFTILFDLDGTLVDTAPDLMLAHNHVMRKFGYPTKSTEDIRNLVGKGAGALIGRSIWGQAKKEFGKVNDEKTKNEMDEYFIQLAAYSVAHDWQHDTNIDSAITNRNPYYLNNGTNSGSYTKLTSAGTLTALTIS